MDVTEAHLTRAMFTVEEVVTFGLAFIRREILNCMILVSVCKEVFVDMTMYMGGLV